MRPAAEPPSYEVRLTVTSSEGTDDLIQEVRVTN